jgi:hypothetical protein
MGLDEYGEIFVRPCGLSDGDGIPGVSPWAIFECPYGTHPAFDSIERRTPRRTIP